MNFIARCAAEKSAVAAMASFDKGDVRIGGEEGAGVGQEADKGIVLRTKDERGNRDLVYYSGTGGTIVIVIRAAEAAVGSDDPIVELADRSDAADAGGTVDCGEEPSLLVKAAHQAAEEVDFIDAVGWLVKGVGAGGKVDGRTNGGDGRERRAGAPLAGKFEREVAAHGVAD